MLDYLFQHFYSTLTITIFCIIILILYCTRCKHNKRWIPITTASCGYLSFLVVFLLLTAIIIQSFIFLHQGAMAEFFLFISAWLIAIVCSLIVISRLTNYCLLHYSDGIKKHPDKPRDILIKYLRNKGIFLFVILGLVSLIIDLLTLPLPIPELPPGSVFSSTNTIPLPPEIPFDVRISSRVTTRFLGECDFDVTVYHKNGDKYVYPAILLNPGGKSAISIYRLRAENKKCFGNLIFSSGMQSCLFNMDTLQMKSLSGPASNYPPPSVEDKFGENMEQRLDPIGLYRGLSFIHKAEQSPTTRSYVLKILEDTHPDMLLHEQSDETSSESIQQ